MSRFAPLSGAVAAATLLAVAAGGGTAAAKPIDRGTVHEELDFVVTDFCGVDGLDVDFHADVVFEYAVRSRGSHQLPYFTQLATGTRTFTNPDNDRMVTESFNGIEKDLQVTDNALPPATTTDSWPVAVPRTKGCAWRRATGRGART